MIKSFLGFLKKRKWTFGFIALALVIGSIYGYQKMVGGQIAPTYVTTQAEIGTLIKTVSGSGQVSATNQIDLKAKASGDVLKVVAKNGDSVKKGAALVELEATDAKKSVRDAQLSLESAKIAYEKLVQKADALTLLQARNSVADAENALEKLKTSQPIDLERAEQTLTQKQDDLAKSYDDAYNTTSDTFLDLPDTITALYNTLYSFTLSESAGKGNNEMNDNYLINTITASDYEERETLSDMSEDTGAAYSETKALYDAAFNVYKKTSRDVTPEELKKLLTQSISTLKSVSATLKKEANLFDYWVQYRDYHHYNILDRVTQYQTELSTQISQTNQLLSNLMNAQSTISSNEYSATNAEQDLALLKKNQPLDLAAAKASLAERKSSLADLIKGTDPLDIRSQELTLKQRNYALQDAQEQLANATVRAPFDGVVAEISVQVGDSVSSGGSAGTFITQQRIAETTLNEVDVASVQAGQKATLTFDAIDGLTITGIVSDIDAIGAVSQGVVSYGIKISFDTQDERIKSGMSVSANIITAVKTDALLVPSEAVKSEDGKTGTVDVLVDGAPKTQTVELGLSDDTSIEITSGLNEGDAVITQTSTAQSTKTTTQSGNRSLFQSIGGGGGTPR